jgi:hypothetical protein
LYREKDLLEQDSMDATLPTFLNALFAEGRVRVAAPAEIAERELHAADQVLAAMEKQYRQELPGTPPPLTAEVARWGAVMFYRACQFVAYRDLGEEQMDASFQPECPGDDSAGTHYSVDLTFRYLPDLLNLAQNASEGDPLLKRLRHWADRWPLSSVGVAGTSSAVSEAVTGHPCLLRLYTDRVIARRDVSRLADPRVRECVSQSLGIFPDLAPQMAAALRTGEPDRN